MKICSKCKKAVSAYYIKYCPFCGSRFDSDHKSQKQNTNAGEKEYILAKNYYYGIGGEKNLEEAFAWYLKAAEKGYSDAQYKVGYMYDNGEGVKEDKEEAFEWYMKAAKKGHTSAQCNLGYMYFYGKGVKEDKEEAFAW